MSLLERRGPELTAEQLYEILRLRSQVFVVEQESLYADIDGRDLVADTRHLWFAGPSGVDSYLRVLAEPDGGARIGRVVTAAAARGRGLAGKLMEAALDLVGSAPCVLDSQVYAQGFYAKFGFVAEGEPFDEDGIDHITMRRARTN
ncbi:GNAT family N-acetyltransferase [Amycolatopsis minnesotensis]|uniref:GNAT family N-acetyltransferase n=1 Tax=Amycolatopsis minnesotensis TaxID=337894 RepID=A0ABN2SSA3_9PSEU